MEIEVGEYVRLKNGLIGQFYNIEEGYDGNVQINFEEFGYEYEDIGQFYNDIKLHSKILSEVVEVGDYVNGNIVTDKYLFAGEKPVIETEGNDTNCKCLCEKDIKTILTKEIYEANCYTVERKKEC